MKKKFMPLAKKTAKSAFALSLAATMVVPTGVCVAADDEKSDEAESVVVVPEPIKTIDFENGLKGVKKDFPGLEITKSSELYVQKSADEVEVNEKVDANGLVYTGGGADAKYYKTLVSNQPTTAWDDVKGTVLKIGKSYKVPAIYKNKSASTDNADTTAALDKELPYTAAPVVDDPVEDPVTGDAVTGDAVTGDAVTGDAVTGDVSGEAVSGAAAQTLADDVSADGVLVQEEYIANSEIVIDNPYGSEELRKELQEYSEYDNPEYDVTWIKYRGKYQPLWNKGLTLSYWINVPSDENGLYKPSSALRWELLNQTYYQADDYGKYLACTYYDIEAEELKEEYSSAYAEEGRDYETERKKNESKVIYGSDYYFKYAEVTGQTDEDGAPVASMRSDAGYNGPLYDARFFDASQSADEEEPPHVSAYYAYNPVYQRGYLKMADGSIQSQAAEYADSYYAKFSTLDPEQGSYVRYADDVDGELQIDVDNSIFWVPDNNLGIQANPNRQDTYGRKQGMNNGDVFFMNSWQSGSKTDARGNGTYQSSKTQAISPVTSIKDYNPEDGSYTGVKNGNCNTWHQVTVTLQNDWVEFYVDGVCANVDETYSSRGENCLDNKKSFKRLNKGTGLRYGWGSEKDAINFSYGNYVCRMLMDWITDEEATLHIGGAGQYAVEYAQATGSCEFSIDDLKFYGELLSPEQIVAAYDQEVADMNKVAAITGTAVDVNKVDVTAATDVSVAVKETAVTTNESVTIEGKTVDNVIKVAANAKKTTATGAKVANPFAGKDLEGATIAYWVKQSDKDYTSVLSFIDTPKYVNNPKGDGAEASSILYVHNDGEASFIEGYSDANLATKLGNACATASDATGAAAVTDKTSSDWTYVIVTMTNAGIKYYVNGELVENMAENPAGARFLDGYYTRVKDEADVQKKYGMFGGTNNQGASTLMGFLTADDTELYLGFSPDKGGMMYSKTSECSFADVKTVDAALTDEEVKTLYDERFNEGVQVTPGDISGDGDIKLDDAQTVLKIALKLKQDATEAQLAAADVNKDGVVDLKDAQLILKRALKLIKEF